MSGGGGARRGAVRLGGSPPTVKRLGPMGT
jgi:hypothetical protein